MSLVHLISRQVIENTSTLLSKYFYLYILKDVMYDLSA